MRRDKTYPTEVFIGIKDGGLSKDSVLMLQQIRTVSTNRISGEKIGEIKDETIRENIKQALIAYFELD